MIGHSYPRITKAIYEGRIDARCLARSCLGARVRDDLAGVVAAFAVSEHLVGLRETGPDFLGKRLELDLGVSQRDRVVRVSRVFELRQEGKLAQHAVQDVIVARAKRGWGHQC